MERDNAAMPVNRGMQRGYVGESDQRTRIFSEALIVDSVQKSHRAISPANAPDRIDRIIADRLVEISDALFIGTGEISIGSRYVSADNGSPSKRAYIPLRALEVPGVTKHSGGSDKRYASAGFEWFHRAEISGLIWHVHCCLSPHSHLGEFLTEPKNTSRKEDLLDNPGDRKASKGSSGSSGTSGSREESMSESESSAHDPSSSGTTPLGGESRDSQNRRGAGGVEGEGASS
jgi:hypothetical protein